MTLIYPESFDTIDVVTAFGKLVLAVIDPKVLAVANIDQAVVATPAVRVNDALEFDFSAYNRLKSAFRTIWNDFRINVTVALKDAENDGFVVCATASFPFDATCAKELFVNLNLS